MKILAAVARTVMNILRELGDENAYQRYLSSHRQRHSALAYREFQKEHFRQKYQRAKCC